MYKIYFIFEFQIKFFSPSPPLTLFLYSHVAYVIWQISKVLLKNLINVNPSSNNLSQSYMCTSFIIAECPRFESVSSSTKNTLLLG